MLMLRSSLIHRCAVFLFCTSAGVFAADPPVITNVQSRAGTPVAIAGEVIDIIGSNLAGGVATAASWPLPISSGTTTVNCGGYPAPILSTSPGIVRIQVPWEIVGLASTQVQVTRDGLASPAFQLTLSEFAPFIVSADSASVAPGQTLTIRAAGMGPRSQNPLTGYGPTADAPGPLSFRILVLIGGVPAPVTATALSNRGDPQNDVGVESIAVQVPWNAPTGDGIPVQIQVGGVQSNSFPISVTAAPIQISLSPSTANVPLNGRVTFQASVQGTDDSAVTWSLDPNGYSLANTPVYYGQISQTGVFSATYFMTPPNWVIARATHASGAFVTTLIQLVAMNQNSYKIVPDNPVITAGDTVTFTLVGPDGSPVADAKWTVSDGFIGSYSATYTATPYAASQAVVHASLLGPDGYFYYDVASTVALIDPLRPQITGISPGIAHIGEAVTFLGTGVSARSTYAWFTAADGSKIRTLASGAAATVPHGAVTGPAWLEVNLGSGSAFLSPPFKVMILPRLRLHSSRPRVSSGEVVAITAAAPDIPGPWPLTWRADFGLIDANGNYQAPTVNQAVFARIWACLKQSIECATTIVEVIPFRLEPDPLVLNPGEQVTLKAWQGGGPVTPTWKAGTANIVVLPNGTVTAGTGPFDGGPALVNATYAGLTQRLWLSIRSPGAVANTAEFYDWLGYDNNSATGRTPLGVISGPIAVHGNWIYTLSNSIPPYYSGLWQSTWLDVYQLNDRHVPVWSMQWRPRIRPPSMRASTSRATRCM